MTDLVLMLFIAMLFYLWTGRCVRAATWMRQALTETDAILTRKMKEGTCTTADIHKAFDCILPQFDRIVFDPRITTYDKAFPWLAEYRRTRPLP